MGCAVVCFAVLCSCPGVVLGWVAFGLVLVLVLVVVLDGFGYFCCFFLLWWVEVVSVVAGCALFWGPNAFGGSAHPRSCHLGSLRCRSRRNYGTVR